MPILHVVKGNGTQILGVKLILSQRLHVMAAAAVTVLGSMFAINTATKSVEAIDTNTSAQHQAQSNDSEATAKDTAKTVVKTNSVLHPAKKIVIKPGRNLIAEANERAAAKKAAEAKAAALKLLKLPLLKKQHKKRPPKLLQRKRLLPLNKLLLNNSKPLPLKVQRRPPHRRLAPPRTKGPSN